RAPARGAHPAGVADAGSARARRFESGPKLTPQQMVDGVRETAAGWEWERVSVGVPAPVLGGRVASDPVVNDAAMQALGRYEGGKMLVIGGANAKKLDELPPRSRFGSNGNAFAGLAVAVDRYVAGLG